MSSFYGTFNSYILLTLLAAVIFTANADRYSPRTSHGKIKPCPISFRCSDEEKVVWATDNISCFVFRNNCYLLNENCDRQNRYIQVLKEVSRQACQKLCNDVCTADYRPVCGIYNNTKHTFSNSCMLSNHICHTGETYILFKEGACEISA